MKAWISFFLGTPKRFMYSVIALMLVMGYINPQFVNTLVHNLLIAFGPLIGNAIAIELPFGEFE